MNDLILNKDPRVEPKFQTYPTEIRPKIDALRQLILEVASEDESIGPIEETLKWGEPSYLAKKGSTVRINWNPKAPDQYAMYFKCTSKMVTTIQEIYGDLFRYEGTRALVFGLDEELPKEELKNCIYMALRYHSLKHLPMLGS